MNVNSDTRKIVGSVGCVYESAHMPPSYLVSLLAVVFILVGCDLMLGYIHYKVEEVPWLLMQLFDNH